MEKQISNGIEKEREERRRWGCRQTCGQKTRSSPLLLGEELDKQIQLYLLEFRQNSTVVNTAIAIKVWSSTMTVTYWSVMEDQSC